MSADPNAELRHEVDRLGERDRLRPILEAMLADPDDRELARLAAQRLLAEVLKERGGQPPSTSRKEGEPGRRGP